MQFNITNACGLQRGRHGIAFSSGDDEVEIGIDALEPAGINDQGAAP